MTLRVVLDASAILAIIHREPGHEKLDGSVLARAVASAVNLAEVQSKLVRHGWPPEEAWEDATSTVQEVLPFEIGQARIAGDLAVQTRELGLSLGDRACLALALSLEAPIYTSDKIWRNLRLSVPIHLLR